jgi:hypothetical protein
MLAEKIPDRRTIMKASLLLLAVLFFACLAADITTGADDKPGTPAPRFKITTRRTDDVVEVRPDERGVGLTIKSPFGISQATVERLTDDWPKTMPVRLYLKGLSNFRASNGKLTLEAAVSARDGRIEVREWKDGKEDARLDEKDPCWMAIRVLGRDGKPASDIPLEGGYFEVTLPRVFFADNPRSITLRWIDFYR